MNSRSILLVEDNYSDIELTRRALHKKSITNQLAVKEDGMDAIEYLFEDCPKAGNALPDLILLDLKLPRMGGLDVLKELKANPLTRHLPVVILTSSGETEDIQRSYELGANSYIRKQLNFDNFVDAISTLEHYWLDINLVPS